eukprot:1131496-Prymnesium_polylepis.1
MDGRRALKGWIEEKTKGGFLVVLSDESVFAPLSTHLIGAARGDPKLRIGLWAGISAAVKVQCENLHTGGDTDTDGLTVLRVFTGVVKGALFRRRFEGDSPLKNRDWVVTNVVSDKQNKEVR